MSKKPSTITSFLCIIETEKPVPGLIDLVAARAWTIDGVKIQGGIGATCTAVKAEPFDRRVAAKSFRENLARRLFAKDAADMEDIIGELLEDLLMRHGGVVAKQIQPNCFSNNDGDTWLDNPADADFVDHLVDGDIFELQASVRSWSERYRVQRAPDSDDVTVVKVD